MYKPTQQYFPFFKNYNVGMLEFGRNVGTTWWNISRLRHDKAQPATKDQVAFANILSDTLRYHEDMRDITRLYAPRIDFSGTIAEPEDLTKKINLPRYDMPIFRHPKDKGSDGVVVSPGSAGLINGADCPIVVFYRPPTAGLETGLIAAHCGRWSLLNQAWVCGEEDAERQHQGVVENAIDRLGRQNVRIIMVHIALSINGRYFDHTITHPFRGSFNRRLIDYINNRWAGCFMGPEHLGALHLPALIRAQCIQYGVPEENISWDREDAYDGREHQGSSQKKWWSYRREAKAGTSNENKRNLAVIIHKAA